jgi:hypothetical protein
MSGPVFLFKWKMRPKFTILFNYMDFLFIGEVSRQLIGRASVYNVFYAMAANPESIDEVEIYRGSGAYNSKHWRQRCSQQETVLADPNLVEIIGHAIKIQEDIESK